MYRKVVLAVLAMIAALSLISCGTDYETTAEAVENDMGDKARVYLPKIKHRDREDDAVLELITIDPEESDCSDYLYGGEGTHRYLYINGKAQENGASDEAVYYDAEKNRLVLNNYIGEDICLYGEHLGSDFTLEIHGDCCLNFIQIIGGGLTIEGEGALQIYTKQSYPCIYLNCLPEKDRFVLYPGIQLRLGKYRYPDEISQGGSVMSTSKTLIEVHSLLQKNLYYMAPLRLSDGSAVSESWGIYEGAGFEKTSYTNSIDGVLNEESGYIEFSITDNEG